MGKTFVFDTEVYVNCTLFCAQEIDSGERMHMWIDEPDSRNKLRMFVETYGMEFIGFNSGYFDDVVVNAWISGLGPAAIKELANRLIVNRVAPWSIAKELKYSKFSSVDLIGAAPPFVGLKTLGARMHMPMLQDLPIPHDARVSEEQRELLFDYCWNDVETTIELTKRLNDQLMLRVDMSRKYKIDLRSKSDAQLAERTLAIALGLKNGSQSLPPEFVTYTPPKYLNFRSAKLADLLHKIAETKFSIDKTGHVRMPEYLNDPVEFGTGAYKLGVGGIHSVHDRSVCYVAGADDVICDIDAASFYPSIILQCGFIPAGLGKPFVEEFGRIYERRLQAKREGDKNTDASLKVAINSVFGQFGNKFSVLYAPDLMLAVTLTGQFTLLMLIEWLEQVGAVTLSANTDGIAIRYNKSLGAKIKHVVAVFSELSRFQFEYTEYRVLAMKDVNNYIAVKPDRSLKEKGIYAPLSLKKNPTAGVCAAAVGQWLAKGTPLLETIKKAPFCDFLSARNVTGGGVQGGAYLGRVVRWYQSNSATLGPIVYSTNGNKVPKTDGARACMQLISRDVHPTDLDYAWYYKEAVKIAIALGCKDYLTPEELQLVATPPKPPKKSKS